MCSPPLAGGEHAVITHQHSSERSCTAYYKNVYGIRPVTDAPEHGRLARRLWFRSTAVETRSIDSSPTSNTSSTRFVAATASSVRPPAAACSTLTYPSIPPTLRTMPADQDASKGYDPTAEEYYHGYGCTIVSTGQKHPDCRGVHREQASARGEIDARHV